MKKTILIFVLVFGLLNHGQSQTITPKDAKWQQVSLGLGSSVPGILANVIAKSSYINSSFATPVINLTYSYLLQDNISIGAVVAYQDVYFDLLPLPSHSSGITFNVNRLNLSLHTEYYFVQNDNFDVYLGGKVGFNTWWGKVSFTELIDYLNEIIPYELITDAIVKDLVPSNENFHSINFTYQFTAGMDYFLTKNIGVKAELAFGAPYWANLGLNYRF